MAPSARLLVGLGRDRTGDKTKMNKTDKAKMNATIIHREPVQYGCVTYPKTGNVRGFVLAMADPGSVIVWCDGFAKLCR